MFIPSISILTGGGHRGYASRLPYGFFPRLPPPLPNFRLPYPIHHPANYAITPTVDYAVSPKHSGNYAITPNYRPDSQIMPIRLDYAITHTYSHYAITQKFGASLRITPQKEELVMPLRHPNPPALTAPIKSSKSKTNEI